MSSTKPLVWLITGCSSGFGTSLAFIALKAGHKVIATSRTPANTPDLVKQVEDLGGIWLALDVSGPLSLHHSVVEEGIKHFGRIDVLVNSAGIGLIGAVEDFRYIPSSLFATQKPSVNHANHSSALKKHISSWKQTSLAP